jgi:hypothetical protein
MDKRTHGIMVMIVILILALCTFYIILKSLEIDPSINLHENSTPLRICQNKLWFVPGMPTYNTTCLLMNGATITP